MTDSAKSRLTSQIREEAARLGFFKVGVAPAGPVPGGEHFEDWIHQGMHGQMAYLEAQKAKRTNPALVLEEVRSLVVLAMNYHCGDSVPVEGLQGSISRYALGGDYHGLMRDRLRRLHDFILRSAPGAHLLHYVDTGPVMEKAWGARTSLGWMGKHTNLITREQGSWFFIGVLLTNLELEHDFPEDDYCGTCARCMEACPTRAIVAPYVVDARLCISYLTIELRGSIPRPLRPLIGNRIFGCDDCQEVCPWNRFAVSTPEKEFLPRDGLRVPDLIPLVFITAAEFNKRFCGSPMRRAKRDGLVRNVVVALGNSRLHQALPALAHAIRDESALVRAHAAWALGQIDAAESRRLLGSAATAESDRSVLAEIALARLAGGPGG
jgi:epoxyqueuosine reductase